MTYVLDCKNDVFISYAHVDNEPNPVGMCWVNQFVQNLETELRRRLAGTPDLKVFFDRRNLGGNDHLKELLQNARSSALLVAILSPAYAARTWTKDELAAFTSAAAEPGRIFVIEVLPVEERDAVPEQIAQLHRTAFHWRNVPISNVAYTITPTEPSDNRYTHLLQDVADQMRIKLREMRAVRETGRLQEVKLATPSDRRAVLLAQTTDDLNEEREQIRRYLEQYGVKVFPIRTYPQGGFEFADAFRKDLKQAGLFVQLLGPVASKQPPDLPSSYARFQYGTAKAEGLKTLLWRRPDFDISAVAHHDKSLLLEPDVLAMGLEAFRAEVLRCSQPVAPASGHGSGEPFVFVNADASDTDLAAELKEEFRRHDCMVATRAQTGSAASINQDLEDNIVESDGIIFVYGKAEQTWVRGQLRLYNRLKPRRKKPARVVAIYVCPPEPKAAIDMTVPEAREIDCRHHFSVQPVKDIISGIRQ